MKPIYKLPFAFLIPLTILFYANQSGSIGGKTGSPGDSGATCVECHTGGPATAVSGWITTSIPAAGYTPGQTYQITATGTHSGVSRFGFELTAENTSGGKVGTLIITQPARTQLTNNGNAVTHTFNGTNPTGNSNSWSMNWTAPPTDIGQVRFYAAFNAANGDGNTTGDVIYVSSLFVNAAQPPSLLSVVPNQTQQGQNVVMSITGQNTTWAGTNPNVRIRNVANSNIIYTAEDVVVNSNTSLSAPFMVEYTAVVGVYDLLVDDLVLPASFTITKIPLILSVVPDVGAQGETVELTITADETTWLEINPEVMFFTSWSLPIELPVESVEVISNTVLVATLNIPSDQVLGAYILSVSQCAPLEDAFTVTIESSVADLQAKQLQIYPNPATTQFWLKWDEAAKLRIFDLNGKLVMERSINAGRNAIQINDLKKGIYIVEVVTPGIRKSELLVVR
jgi:hypothetical protein